MESQRTLGGLLDRCRKTINTVKSDTEMKQALANYGYDEQRITNGDNLCGRVMQSFDKQRKENAESYAATKAYLEKKEEVVSLFRKDVKRLRIAAKVNIEMSKLIPTEVDFNSIVEFFKTARVMYQNLANTPAYTSALATVGFKPADFTDRIGNFDELDSLRIIRDKEQAESVAATSNRDKEFDELQAFCKDLRTIAKIAVEDKPALKKLVDEL